MSRAEQQAIRDRMHAQYGFTSSKPEPPKQLTETHPPTSPVENPTPASLAIPIKVSPAKSSERPLKMDDFGEPSSDWKP
jgi:hypothetical protein